MSLRGEGRDSENTNFDSATALHFWSVKQLSKIDSQNSLPQYPKPARYLWFWQNNPLAWRFWVPSDLKLLLLLASKQLWQMNWVGLPKGSVFCLLEITVNITFLSKQNVESLWLNSIIWKICQLFHWFFNFLRVQTCYFQWSLQSSLLFKGQICRLKYSHVIRCAEWRPE